MTFYQMSSSHGNKYRIVRVFLKVLLSHFILECISLNILLYK